MKIIQKIIKRINPENLKHIWREGYWFDIVFWFIVYTSIVWVPLFILL